ncbi:Hypothetical protein PBC10988_10260 [Planctomycetales bacterium 10988]|nr:Hypothetical protein PBC10988_10260 [Planctomycetales bacterium 10988]
MFYGVSHFVLEVSDLGRAKAYYCDVLEMEIKEESKDQLILDAGTTDLYIIEKEDPQPRSGICFQVGEMPWLLERLAQANVEFPETVKPAEGERWEILMTDGQGNQMILWQKLGEDDWANPVPLPAEIEWTEEAEELMQGLLKRVPALFRDLARKKAVAETELLAENNRVIKEHVVRGYIRANPRITRFRVKKPIREMGYNPEDYAEDFNY